MKRHPSQLDLAHYHWILAKPELEWTDTEKLFVETFRKLFIKKR